MAVLMFTQGRFNQPALIPPLSSNSTELLVGMLTPTVLLAVLATKVSADLYGQLGYFSEQLLQSKRLPHLNISPPEVA